MMRVIRVFGSKIWTLNVDAKMTTPHFVTDLGANQLELSADGCAVGKFDRKARQDYGFFDESEPEGHQ